MTRKGQAGFNLRILRSGAGAGLVWSYSIFWSKPGSLCDIPLTEFVSGDK